MDEYSRKRAGGGFVFSKNGAGTVLRDSSDNKDQNGQICSRVGCGSRLNSGKNIQISADKAKSSRQSLRSSANGKEVNGSSSRTSTVMNSSRKLYTDTRKKLADRLETDSETSNVRDEGENSEPTPTQGETRSKRRSKPQFTVSKEAALSEAGSSSSVPHGNRNGKRSAQRLGLSNLDNSSSSSMSMTFRDTNQGMRKAPVTSRYNLRNFKCNSVSDVIQSGSSSSSESSVGNRKREVDRKRIDKAENSFSVRGKKIGGPLLDDSRRNDNMNRGISISDSRRTRNLNFGRNINEVASVRTRRSNPQTLLSNQENRHRLLLNEEPISTPVFAHPDISLDSNGLGGAEFHYFEASSSHLNSTCRPGSRNGNTCGGSSRSPGPHDVGIARSFLNRDSLRQYNLDGIAEVLLALERIEQDEELSYEQLLVLETNLFLGGLGYHDQHRDMRLDIDNMSYEELLALEERMGSVSTALSEEDLAKSLKRSTYQSATTHEPEASGREDSIDDIKCSICQEEYNQGDEMGRVECEHRFHVECIQQWLRLKNWCPICKVSAAPSSPSASSLDS